MTKYLKEYFPYLALFLLGAFAASSFSPFATISKQGYVSSIDTESLNPTFPLAVGTIREYEGWLRQQEGQEQNPPRQSYRVVEKVIQHDKARNGTNKLITITRQEYIGEKAMKPQTIGYLTDGTRYYRIENEDGLDAVRKEFYGDDSERDIVAELSRMPTYDFSTSSEGCYRIASKNLSSDYAETFCEGIGPTAISYTHHGTIDEYSLELVKLEH